MKNLLVLLTVFAICNPMMSLPQQVDPQKINIEDSLTVSIIQKLKTTIISRSAPAHRKRCTASGFFLAKYRRHNRGFRSLVPRPLSKKRRRARSDLSQTRKQYGTTFR